jgi:glycosyltransferase involved in cell wall biosynthesis
MGAVDDDDVVVGFVGRMVNEKGIPELIDAAAHVMARHPRARFALIGPHDATRSDDVSVETLDGARALGIKVLGHRDDVAPYYAGMDLFVLPSHREGFPRSVMEASAMGVPVVATDIRGCREAVTNESGILVPIRDAPSLTHALCALASDSARRSVLSGGATRLARERFDVKNQVDISLDVYFHGLRQAETAFASIPELRRALNQ